MILERFHHQTARQIVGMTAIRVADGTWEYPPVVAALEVSGLYSMHGCIRRRKKTIAVQVEYLTIYEICTNA